jgi:glycosyltransferase involved in cell wall biosynthesis
MTDQPSWPSIGLDGFATNGRSSGWEYKVARILIVGKYYPPFAGGLEQYTRDICVHLAKSHDVTAVVYNHEKGHKDESVDGVRVIRCAPQLVLRSQPIALSMLWHIDLRGIDIVHFQAPNFFANAILLLKLSLRRRAAPRIVVTHHTDVFGRRMLRAIAMPVYRALVRKADAVIVTSRKNAMISLDLPPTAPITVIPLGIDTAKYFANESVRAAAMSWRRDRFGDAPVVAFIGRHARFKGLEVLIHAMEFLPNAHVVIAGDGPYRGAAELLAVEIGVANRVSFLGTVTDIGKKIELLAAADVFAFPSTEITETFGISQLEAMAVGTPVVASDLPTGVTDVAISEQTALIAPPGDPIQLAERIRRILSDEQLAARLAAAAQKHVRQNFEQERVLERTRELIERCIGRSKKSGTAAQDTTFAKPQDRLG